MNKVYHGSGAAGLRIIEPRPSVLLQGLSVIFSTPLWIVALIMGTGWKDDSLTLGLERSNNLLVLTEQKKGAFEEFLHRPTTVYTLDYDAGEWYHDERLWCLEFISQKKQCPIREELVMDPWVVIEKEVKLVDYR